MSKRNQTKFVDEAKFVEDEVELLEEQMGNLGEIWGTKSGGHNT